MAENETRVEDGYSSARAVNAEGARIGLVICKKCGAALTLDPAEKVNVLELHTKWHKELATEVARELDLRRRANHNA